MRYRMCENYPFVMALALFTVALGYKRYKEDGPMMV
jgi:hypothetical protein